MRVRAIPSGHAQAQESPPLGSACQAGASLAWLVALLDGLALVPAGLLQALPGSPLGSVGLLCLGVLHLSLGWFLGGHACLRYPWWSICQLFQRQLLVVGATLLAGSAGLVWLPLVGGLGEPLLILWKGLLLGTAWLALWGLLLRLGMRAMLRRRFRWQSRKAAAPTRSRLQAVAAGQEGRSLRPAGPGGADRWVADGQGGGSVGGGQPGAGSASGAAAGFDPAAASQPSGIAEAVRPPQRQLLLLLVAYHPSAAEVEQLLSCLNGLPASIGHAVVVNDHRPGEAAERLAQGADAALFLRHNQGYGRAVNRLVAQLGFLPAYLGVLNTDLLWRSGCFERLLSWLQQHPEVSLAVPRIVDPQGTSQMLCKRHPTLLGLCSRRFLPERLKPAWLKRYDRWYVMADHDYDQVLAVPYLSGCCMLINSQDFLRVGGFDEQYFLYLEDADISRCLAAQGLCLHVPVASVEHGWGRGNYRSFKLMLVNLLSAWLYFRKWGWALW